MALDRTAEIRIDSGTTPMTYHAVINSGGWNTKPVPYNPTPTGTGIYPAPVFYEEWSIVSTDDEKSRTVYEYILEKSEQSFRLESLAIELGIGKGLIIQKGELNSILIQMVSDGVLKYDKTQARYTLNQ